MKKLVLLSFISLTLISVVKAQSTCAGNLVTNDTFNVSMTDWTQYGALNGFIQTNSSGAGCLVNDYLVLPKSVNSTSGDTSSVRFEKDTCYQLCYCYEFPANGSLFNNKLFVAAITPGVTAAQLVSGAYTAAQAMIIDTISSTTAIAANTQCPAVFTAGGNYTAIAFINQTIGSVGTDINIDNVCLTKHPCATSVGIDENEDGNALFIMPNPAADYLFIKAKTKIDRMVLINLQGQQVGDIAVQNNTALLPQSLANGLYISVLYTNKAMVYKRITVNR